jgi:biopolymer transport protein ExbD
VVVRGRDGATLGDLVAALDALRAAGFGNLVLAE